MTRATAIPDAVAAAARWHLLALVFERPREGWSREIAAVAREVDDVVLRALAGAARDATEGEYLGLVGPGGHVPAREVGYGGFRDPGWVLADLARYYDAFGYAPGSEDPLDHVAVETGFVAYLHLKEALACAAGDEECAGVTRRARESFVREHLAGFAASLARRLAADDAGYLAAAAELLTSKLPAVDPPTTPEDGDPFARGCGGCTGSG